MRARAWLCIGTLCYLAGCGSDDGKTVPKDAGGETGKNDVAPTNPDVVDAPPLAADVPLPLDGSAIDGNPADTAQPSWDGGAAEAGQPEVLPALFTSSACKKSATSTSIAAPGTLFDNQAGLDGLECIGWQRGSADAQIDLFNFDGAYGAIWAGDGAVAADGSIDLAVDNIGCSVAGSGICLYDWSFTLPSPIPANQAEPVSVRVGSCWRNPTSTAATTASVGSEESGIRCRFAHYGALAQHASVRDLCGTAGMPCVGSSACGSGSASSTGTCDSGLVCDSSAAPYEPRCLVPCEQDADCPRTDVWACTSGLCRPRGF